VNYSAFVGALYHHAVFLCHPGSAPEAARRRESGPAGEAWEGAAGNPAGNAGFRFLTTKRL